MLTLSDYRTRLAAFWKTCNPAETIPALRYLCRTDLYFLLRYACGRSDMEREWLFQRCVEVQNDPNGRLDLWARESYKSTIISFGKTIQDILASHGDDPLPIWQGRELTCGIFSHTRPVAKGFLRQIKFELEGNTKLIEWFPDVLWQSPRKEAPKWSEDDGIIVRRKSNPKEATVEGWGLVDGQPTGKHFLLMVYDDVVTQESVTTPDQIEKTTRSTELSYNLGADGGIRRAIGTRYHFNDTYKTLMERGTFRPRVYPATVDGTVDGEPVLLTRERLAEKRRDMGPFTFGAQMLLNPLADETQGFKEDWLLWHDGFNRVGMNVYLLFDPAGSKNKRSDYTSGWAVGLAPDRNVYVLDMVRDRLNLTQRAKLVMDWHRKWRPVRDGGVRYEKYGLMADIEYLREVQKQANYRFDVTEVGGQLPKVDRIRRLVPMFEQGRIYLPRTHYYTDREGKTSDLVQDFVQQEYKAFPVSVHDDMLDSLARLLEPDLELIWPEIQEYSEAELLPPEFVDG